MKTLCIVQARMGSERLQGKVIKPILGKSMILYTLDRLSKCRHIDQLVLATSTMDREEPLVKVVEEASYTVFRGDEVNVLKRYKDAVDRFSGDIIIRVTGDCPLIDFNIVDNVISYFKMYNYDYVRLDVPNSVIRGLDVEVFSKEALDKVYKLVDKEEYKEHVTLFMYRHPEIFNISYVKGEEFYNKDYRLCVDTKEDFELVSKIYEHFKHEYVSSKEVVKFLESNLELAKINSDIMQKRV